ncbi:hypothetical protein RI129_006323 [Pyrocoelia pectoralis]|uniref:MICAL-like protein 1 n=1 Tax=Pyrocoelia pectoralis TaxID=417401 RepID=A0AAN7ZNK3_9COLE
MGERRGTKGLELWCRRMTEGYAGVAINNMTTSWRDGLGFCAIIHHFRPDLIDFSKLNKEDIYYNNDLAFQTAERHLGIPALLEPEDMVEYPVPDRLSILTYLSQYYQTFVVAQGSPSRIVPKRPSNASVGGVVSPSSKSPSPKIPRPSGGVGRREPCAKCGLPVFIAERLSVGKQLYHRTCFRCARCNSQLTLANYYETEIENQFCCEICPDEEEPALEKSVLNRSLSDEEKSIGLQKFEDPDDYSSLFETALEKQNDSSTDHTRNLRSSFFNSHLAEEDVPDLPKSMPPILQLSEPPDLQRVSESIVTTDRVKDLINDSSSIISAPFESFDSGYPSIRQEDVVVNSSDKLSDDINKNQHQTANEQLDFNSAKEKKNPSNNNRISLVKSRALLFESKCLKQESSMEIITPQKLTVPLESPIINSGESSDSINRLEICSTKNNGSSVEDKSIEIEQNLKTPFSGKDEEYPEDLQTQLSVKDEEYPEGLQSAKDEEYPEDLQTSLCVKNEKYPEDLHTPLSGKDEEYSEDLQTPLSVKDEEYPEDLKTSVCVKDEEYSEDLNTPSSAKDEEYPEDLNPFGEDEEECKHKVHNVPKPAIRKKIGSKKVVTPKSYNPFDEDDDDITERVAAAVPVESTIRVILVLRGKKKPAPKPPTVEVHDSPRSSVTSSPSVSVQHSPKATPKLRKNKKAPLPPSVTSTPSTKLNTMNLTVSPISTDSSHWSDEKIIKDEVNRNRQSQIIISSESSYNDDYSLPNKSTYGKWKRRKGPAPSRPIPQRRHIKPLPVAEIKRELDFIEIQQQGLEKQGVKLEQIIREKCEGPNEHSNSALAPEVEDLILQLFELVNEKNDLFRKQAELMYLRRQQRLEEEYADLEYQIRCLMLQPEINKTDSDKAREEELINRLVEVVERRNEIVECLEMDRIREAEEDDSINNQLTLYTLKREDLTAKVRDDVKQKKKKKEKKFKIRGSKKTDADKDVDESECSTTTAVKEKKKKKFSIFNKNLSNRLCSVFIY